jgi:hypothetical protein
MKKIIVLLVVLFLSAQVGYSQTAATAKKQIVKELKGKKVDKARGANPNIKTDVPTVDKPVVKARGGCNIYFDNYTGYYVKVYVDGNYKGTLDGWGGGWVSVGGGYTTIYCVTTGGSYEWSANGDCNGEYRFKLSVDTAD